MTLIRLFSEGCNKVQMIIKIYLYAWFMHGACEGFGFMPRRCKTNTGTSSKLMIVIYFSDEFVIFNIHHDMIFILQFVFWNTSFPAYIYTKYVCIYVSLIKYALVLAWVQKFVPPPCFSVLQQSWVCIASQIQIISWLDFISSTAFSPPLCGLAAAT